MDVLDTARARYRYPMALSNRINWALSRRGHLDHVWVLGYPKSGTTWAAQLASTATGIPFPRLALLPASFRAVLHGHRVPEPSGGPRCLYLVRDGREAMASLFHHRSLRSTVPAGDGFGAFLRRELAEPSGTHGRNWGEHVHAGLVAAERGASVAIVRYEELLDEPVETMGVALEALDVPFTRSSLIGAVDLFSLGRLRGLGSDEFLTSGRRPTWPELFDDEARARFDAACGDELRRLGLVTSDGW